MLFNINNSIGMHFFVVIGRISIVVLVIVVLCSVARNAVYFCDSQVVNCSESDIRALIEFKNGLNDPEDLLYSWKSSNCCL